MFIRKRRHNDSKIRRCDIMIIKQKIHKIRIRILVKTNAILHASRCTARKEKTSLRHTFFDGAKFV